MSSRSRKGKTGEGDTSQLTVKKTPVTTPAPKSLNTSATTTPKASLIRERSSSPLTIARTEEKDELAYLNDRLATYIDYVRQLEKDKERLTRRIQVVTEEQIDKSDSIRKTYEREMASLRALVDDLANQRAQMEIQTKNSKDEHKEMSSNLKKSEKENNDLERKIEQLEKELALLRQDPVKVTSLRSENEALKKKLDASRKDLEANHISRTELENRVSSLKEELDFQQLLLKEEREKMLCSTTYIEEEIDSRKAAEYESRLAEELQEIRQRTNEELDDYKVEIETTFQKKFDQLKAVTASTTVDGNRFRDEISSLRRQLDDMQSKLTVKSQEADRYKARLDMLERQKDNEREDYQKQIDDLRAEVARLNAELKTQIEEFTDLLHVKISLDQEIMMYRRMLEGEESRLKITTPTRDSSFNLQKGKKRRLDFSDDCLDETSYFGAHGKVQYAYNVTVKAVGDVEFDAHQDGSGKWIRLANKSHNEVDISRWTIVQSCDSTETSYEFGANVKMQPNTTCTVWSSNTEAKENPPFDWLMKGNAVFKAGTNISIRLLDKKSVEQSTCTVIKERVRASGRRTMAGREEKCSMM